MNNKFPGNHTTAAAGDLLAAPVSAAVNAMTAADLAGVASVGLAAAGIDPVALTFALLTGHDGDLQNPLEHDLSFLCPQAAKRKVVDEDEAGDDDDDEEEDDDDVADGDEEEEEDEDLDEDEDEDEDDEEDDDEEEEDEFEDPDDDDDYDDDDDDDDFGEDE